MPSGLPIDIYMIILMSPIADLNRNPNPGPNKQDAETSPAPQQPVAQYILPQAGVLPSLYLLPHTPYPPSLVILA